MSQTCPLCGKTKPEEALFCDDCAKKIHAEYEVNIPLLVDDYSDQDPETEKAEVEQELAEELPKRKLKISSPLLAIAIIALLVGAFFIYNTTIRKNSLEHSAWNTTVKSNSVEDYLAYMERYPDGAHFDDAQAGLRRLKSEEADAWERMKKTDNVSELGDFLNQYAGSPYVSLVEARLDSLVWIRTLRTNTIESYSNYMMQAENGEIIGDYIGEARKRYELLSMPQPNDSIASDSSTDPVTNS